MLEQKININSASKEELEKLPKIGRYKNFKQKNLNYEVRFCHKEL